MYNTYNKTQPWAKRKYICECGQHLQQSSKASHLKSYTHQVKRTWMRTVLREDTHFDLDGEIPFKFPYHRDKLRTVHAELWTKIKHANDPL